MSLLSVITVAPLSLTPRSSGPCVFRWAQQQHPLLLLTPGFYPSGPTDHNLWQAANTVGQPHWSSPARQQTLHCLALKSNAPGESRRDQSKRGNQGPSWWPLKDNCPLLCTHSSELRASLAVFQARLDGALSNLVWWKVSLPMAGGLEPDDL